MSGFGTAIANERTPCKFVNKHNPNMFEQSLDFVLDPLRNVAASSAKAPFAAALASKRLL